MLHSQDTLALLLETNADEKTACGRDDVTQVEKSTDPDQTASNFPGNV